MARNPTTWSDNDVKVPAGWTGTTKNATAYTDNVTRNPTAYTTVDKENTDWGNGSPTAEPWLYDDPTQKYDDTPLRGYNYLIPSNNTLNSKVPTAYEEVV